MAYSTEYRLYEKIRGIEAKIHLKYDKNVLIHFSCVWSFGLLLNIMLIINFGRGL